MAVKKLVTCPFCGWKNPLWRGRKGGGKPSNGFESAREHVALHHPDEWDDLIGEDADEQLDEDEDAFVATVDEDADECEPVDIDADAGVPLDQLLYFGRG